LSAKVWNDTNRLICQYGSRLDILYDDVEFDASKSRCERVIFWNQTVT
jgi:hypothetical protein